MWSELLALKRRWGKAWCLLGDFNVIRRKDESKIWGMIQWVVHIWWSLMTLFVTWKWMIYRCLVESLCGIELMGIPKVGLIDFLYHVSGSIVGWGVLNMSLIRALRIMKKIIMDWGLKPSRVMNAWFMEQGFVKMMAKMWVSYDVRGWGAFMLKEKLKLLQKRLEEVE